MLKVGVTYTLIFHNVDPPGTPNPRHGFSGVSDLGLPSTDDISPGHDFQITGFTPQDYQRGTYPFVLHAERLRRRSRAAQRDGRNPRHRVRAVGAARIAAVTETKEDEKAPAPAIPDPNEDDRRAAAAAVNRKRTEKDWEEKKKSWRAMGVPPALPAKK